MVSRRLPELPGTIVDGIVDEENVSETYAIAGETKNVVANNESAKNVEIIPRLLLLLLLFLLFIFFISFI